MQEIYLKQLELGPMLNFVYLVGDAESKECAVIDPAWDVQAILRQARTDGMKISKILVTHGHPDHVNGVEELVEKTKSKIYAQKKEMEWMKWRWPGLVDLQDGETVDVGKIRAGVIHTPGHSPGSQCFQIGNLLFAGDVLFVNSCGRVDLPGGDPDAMYESLMKLRQIADSTILYPGHNYGEKPTSTIGQEKKFNPYLQFSSMSDFLIAVGGPAFNWNF